MAPEVLSFETEPYSGEAADAWSFGLILFAMRTGTLPFETLNSRLYTWFSTDQKEKFWAFHRNSLQEGTFSADFRNLIECCLCRDPSQRPKIS
jgi:serine/threonine protein kinase